MSEKGLQLREPTQKEIDEYADQLLGSLIVGGQKLKPHEARALALVAKMNGLNATTGEIYWIPGSGVDIGVKGLRRNAQNYLGSDEDYNIDFKQVQPSKYGRPDGDIVYEAYLRDTVSLAKYHKTLKMFLELIPNDWDFVKNAVGPFPVWTGVGVCFKEEVEAFNRLPYTQRKGKHNPYEIAQKRAEKAVLRKAYPIGEVGGGMMANSADIPDSDFHMEEVQSEQKTRITAAQAMSDIYGDDPEIVDAEVSEVQQPSNPPPPAKPERPFAPEMLKKSLNHNVELWSRQNVDFALDKRAPGMISAAMKAYLEPKYQDATELTEARYGVLRFLWEVETGSGSELSEYQRKATMDWLGIDGFTTGIDGDRQIPSAEAQQEIDSIIAMFGE